MLVAKMLLVLVRYGKRKIATILSALPRNRIENNFNVLLSHSLQFHPLLPSHAKYIISHPLIARYFLYSLNWRKKDSYFVHRPHLCDFVPLEKYGKNC